MSKLEVKENKKLVLKKVLVKKLEGIQLENLDNEINQFYQQLQLLKVQMYGPLVTRNKGTNIHEDGNLTVDYELYMQAHDYMQYKDHFEVRDEVIANHCLYVRFQDAQEYMQFAFSKLELHIYENDIPVKNDVYTVYVGGTPEKITIDIFRPVDSL